MVNHKYQNTNVEICGFRIDSLLKNNASLRRASKIGCPSLQNVFFVLTPQTSAGGIPLRFCPKES